MVGDPQSDGASKLIRWITVDRVVPSADDFAWLALMTLLPRVGGGAALKQEETGGSGLYQRAELCSSLTSCPPIGGCLYLTI